MDNARTIALTLKQEPPMQDTRAMLESHLDTIPMVKAMQVAIGDIEPTRLQLTAPLSVNLNDKGCAFGGSLVSLMTLAGWALVTARLHDAGFAETEVFVADSEVKYKAPLWDDLIAEVVAAEGESLEDFVAAFAQKGKARITVEARVPLPDGGVATSMRARYAAFAKR
ncbi:thioesterase domain-containing protein, putative [Solilutibacter tolerans]|uniref:Thioesterase domain-containing protein, putative n=2 Tax=Solilutibacter tolerans TaxID=1604334 RepID=A0A1N6R521_9GAMM|nr:thioesterase domain-containing protein, putative [Lysobacter tolerans]